MDEVAALSLIRRMRKKRRNDKLLLNRRRLQHMRYASAPFMLAEDTFRGTYRLSKLLVMSLMEEIRPHLPAAVRSTSVSPEIKVLCALHFFGQGSYQKSAGSDSHLGLSQSSVSRFLEEVTEALNAPGILSKWVSFPMTQEERVEVIRKNFKVTGFPGVIGFVAGTQVAIRSPTINDHLYINSNGYHSINTQIICDSDLIILNCLARFPGTTEDSYIWSQCAANKEMRNVWESGEQCWLLGDFGYPHQPWLQIPIHNAEKGSPEAKYNEIHAKARHSVEQCIGVLKNRFRCLLRHRILEYSPVKAGKIFNACCVLHNMSVRAGVPLPEIISVDEDSFPECQIPPVEVVGKELQEACGVRKDIVDSIGS